MKTCLGCQKSLSLEDFPWQGKSGRRRARCAPCHNQYEREANLRRRTAAGHPYKPRVKPDPASGMKWCPPCQTMKPVDAFALLNGRGTLGRQWECRACHRERAIKSQEADPEHAFDPQRRWKAKNRETYLASERAKKNRRYAADPEKERRARRAWWESLTADERAAWYERNREARLRISGIRRARKKGTQAEPIRRADIIARDKGICYLCLGVFTDRQIHLDHVVPLSRGGTHTADNIRVTCRWCNYHKSDRLLSELDLSQFRLAS